MADSVTPWMPPVTSSASSSSVLDVLQRQVRDLDRRTTELQDLRDELVALKAKADNLAGDTLRLHRHRKRRGRDSSQLRVNPASTADGTVDGTPHAAPKAVVPATREDGHQVSVMFRHTPYRLVLYKHQ